MYKPTKQDELKGVVALVDEITQLRDLVKRMSEAIQYDYICGLEHYDSADVHDAATCSICKMRFKLLKEAEAIKEGE